MEAGFAYGRAASCRGARRATALAGLAGAAAAAVINKAAKREDRAGEKRRGPSDGS